MSFQRSARFGLGFKQCSYYEECTVRATASMGRGEITLLGFTGGVLCRAGAKMRQGATRKFHDLHWRKLSLHMRVGSPKPFQINLTRQKSKVPI